MHRRLIVLAALFLVGPAFVWAADVLVTATVGPPNPPPIPPPIVTIRGLAYPSAVVSITRDGTLLTDVQIGSTAQFDVTLSNQPLGSTTYVLTSTDQYGIASPTVSFTLTLTAGTTTTLSGIFFGPTIRADKTQVQIGDSLTVLGETAPSSSVTVFVSSVTSQSFSANADAAGHWSTSLTAEDLGVGTHEAYAKATAPTAEVSAASSTVSFSVSAAPTTPDVCDGWLRADITCDGRVNLVDFSVLLFYWQQTSPANARTDVNRDGIVDLTDVSIMLFHWTG